MAEENENVQTVADPTTAVLGAKGTPGTGSAGLQTQVPGQPSTVTALAESTGGINDGNLVQPDIDTLLFKFKSDDTPLMQLMLKAKTVTVQSPEVEHYMIDEPKSHFFTTGEVSEDGNKQFFVLPLNANDMHIPQEYGTLLVKKVPGYTEDGSKPTPGKDLMLYVTGMNENGPVVRAVNGPKTTTTDMFCTVPAIPANTEIIVLSNACYETQQEVAPDLIVPQPTKLYLQKRIMNQIVSDYFESQKKKISFSKAIIAEAAITNFKTRSNRTLWASRQGKWTVMGKNNTGVQYAYSTEGVRWQFKRELQHSGKWTVEQVIGLAKMFFTGEDVPKTAVVLAGKNFLEGIQCIDYSKHPEIQITTKVNPVGWEVTNFHTVFGDLQFKREPTLDRLGWSNSAGIFGEDRLVHYKRVADHSFDEKVQGEEAKRTGLIVWDGLGLKGSCHIWVDGEGGKTNEGATVNKFWDKDTAPNSPVENEVYYLIEACPGISDRAVKGTMWQWTGTAWKEYEGEVKFD